MPLRSLRFSFFLVFHLLRCLSLAQPSFLSRPVHLSADVIVPSAARGLGAPFSGLLSLAPSSFPSCLSVCQLLRLIGSHLITASLNATSKSADTALPFSRLKTEKLHLTAHCPLQARTTVDIFSILIIRINSAFFWRQTNNDNQLM